MEIKFLFHIAITCPDLETSTIWGILSLSGIVSISFSESTRESYSERLLELDLALRSKSAEVLSK